MRCVIYLSLGLLAATLHYVQAAPVPKNKAASPAVIDAGSEEQIAAVLWEVVMWARVGVREDKKVAGLDIVRQQKDWESWLKKNLRVERVEGTNRVQIGFRDGSPKEQAAIINAVVDYHLKKNVGFTRDSLTSSLKHLRASLNDPRLRGKRTAKHLAEAQEALKDLEERIRTLPTLVEHAKAR